MQILPSEHVQRHPDSLQILRLAIFNEGKLLGVQTDHYKTAKLLSPHVPQEAAFDIIGNIIKRTINVLMKSFNATSKNSSPLLSEPKL